MRRLFIYSNTIFLCSLCLVLATGCGTTVFHPLRTQTARIGEITEVGKTLKHLPEPSEPVIVAVYQFRDQTGQYKPQDGGSGFSTAVTQGAANILIKVLQDSKWFVPIERENISDLLNERKIIRSTRQQFGVNEELPALLYAGILLEGGIVSYDANMVTGGVGLRYFGTGGGSQYRQDRVTVYLRAVSVSNGKVLKTVYASKSILSQSMDGGTFRFVRFQRLLEAEMGFTYNEPSEIAVTEAIEKAVETMIYEGIQDGLWQPKEIGKKKEIIESYQKIKETSENIDLLQKLTEDQRKSAHFSLAAMPALYKGDFARPKWQNGFQLGFGWNPRTNSGFDFQLGFASLATKGGFKTSIQTFDATYNFRYLPMYRFSLALQFGLGGLHSEIMNRNFGKVHIGANMEWLPKRNIGFFAGFDYNYAFSDLVDARENGSFNDTFWRANAGVKLYFGKKIKNKKKLNLTNAAPPKRSGPFQEF